MKSLWLPPGIRIGKNDQEERYATWLELFYDLIFVVAIAQLTQKLYEDISLPSFVNFVILFLPIWLSWLGTMLYATRFALGYGIVATTSSLL
ncbi:hypothetical protein NUACC21_29530 [Scytonema sp. NUACC21]